jgi:hypothetical protein
MDETLDQWTLFIEAGAEARFALGDPPFGAVKQLAAVGTRQLEHLRDLVVLVVEHFAQEKHAALLRRERLEQNHECQRHRFGERE